VFETGIYSFINNESTHYFRDIILISSAKPIQAQENKELLSLTYLNPVSEQNGIFLCAFSEQITFADH
jgi:hypothetical protein